MDGIKVITIIKKDVPRAGLGLILSSKPNIKVISECATVHNGISKARQLSPDIVLLDSDFPECEFVQAAECIKKFLPNSRIIVLVSPVPKYRNIFYTFTMGTVAFISKDTTAQELLMVVEKVYEGDVIIVSPIAKMFIDYFATLPSKKRGESSGNVISQREQEILNLVAKGCTNKEIADTLSISTNTVKVHLTHILGKMQVSNRRRAIRQAFERGIVE
jgi:NarL family two-component system response regulator LiaR